MPKASLTEHSVNRLKAPTASGKQTLHWDRELKGFGLLLSGVTASKTYVVQRTLPGKKSPRRVTVGSTSEMSLKAAREEAGKLILTMRRGVDPKSHLRRTEATTLRLALKEYLSARSSLAPRSAESYKSLVERHLGAFLDLPLSDITPEMVEVRHRGIKEEVEAGGRYSGNATANAAMVALRTIYNFQIDRDERLPPCPVRRLKRAWFPVHRRERMVRADELPRFHEAVMALPNPVHRDYVLLLLFTGLRRREAAGLTWDDVDMVNRVLRIPAMSTKARRKLDLPMSDLVYDLFVRRGEIGRERYVFPASSKSRHIEEPRAALELVAKATGIAVSAHDLRRSFCTAAEGTDISPIALRMLVNHSLGNGVTEGYIIMGTERLREAAQRVADRMKALCRISGY